MSELQVINEQQVLNKNFKIYGDFENPLFLARDVAEWIEHSNVTDMISRIDCDEVTKFNLGGRQGVCNFLTEDGLYEVLMQSRKPIAKAFKTEVKKILKSLRKGETKLIGMTEYQKLQIETREQNIHIRKAQILERIAKNYKGEYQQVLHSYATKELTGEHVVPLPAIEHKTYSATEIGEILGITSSKVGTLANKHNLKTETYGKFYVDKSRHSNKEVETFRYYDSVIPVLSELI